MKGGQLFPDAFLSGFSWSHLLFGRGEAEMGLNSESSLVGSSFNPTENLSHLTSDGAAQLKSFLK